MRVSGASSRRRTIVCYHALCNLQNPVTRWLDANLARRLLDDALPQPLAGGMTPPPTEFRFLRTLPGRLFLLSSVSLVVLFAIRAFVPLPELLEVFRKVVSLALVRRARRGWRCSPSSHNRRRFLWRVRRKLILSYVFLGVVPVMLVVALRAGRRASCST